MEDVAGFGVQALLADVQWKVGKADFIGRAEAHEFQNGIALKLAEQGKTVVFVRDEKGIAGLLTLKDVVREETVTAVKALKQEGIRTVMLTGDSEKTAMAIASESGIDAYIAECLPETKVEEMKKLWPWWEMASMTLLHWLPLPSGLRWGKERMSL
jgi:Cd2+/Zn2+-exporting ATPase